MNKDNYHEQGNIIIILLLLPLGHISNKFILTSNFEKNLGIAPGKLEESGKILGKDLWVRAHSTYTPLNDLKERLRRFN